MARIYLLLAVQLETDGSISVLDHMITLHTSMPPWEIRSSGGLMVIQSKETVMEMSPAQT
jgi:hypothetical protein